MVNGLKSNKGKSELDKKIHALIVEKRNLYIKEDKKDISRKVFNKEFIRLESELRGLNKLKLKEIQENLNQRDIQIDKKENVVTKKLKVLTPRKKRVAKRKEIVKLKRIKKTKTILLSGSYFELIIKALKHSKVDTEEKVIAIVNVWKPGAHPVDMRKYIKNIISSIKRGGVERYSSYTWDDENYQVKERHQTTL